MSATEDVSKEDRSRDDSDEQPLNIEDISVTRDVSKEDRSRDSREEQPENMSDMSVAEDTSTFSRPSMLTSSLKSAKKPLGNHS